MRVRLWGAWVIEKVYWGRVALAGIVGFSLGFIADGMISDANASIAPETVQRVEIVETVEPVAATLPSPKARAGHLVASRSGVFAYDEEGQTPHRVWTGGAYDVLSLDDGSMVVSARYDGAVVLIDADGAELQRIAAAGPVDCELVGSSLYVIENSSGLLSEFDLETGERVRSVGGFSNHYDVALRPCGEGFVVADSGNGRVVELDHELQQVAEYTDLGFPSSVEVLENGNVQVTTYHGGEVVELERNTGTVLRRLKVEGTVFRALRLDDDSTLVYEGERSDGLGRLHTFSAEGELLSVTPLQGGTDFDLR